MIPAFAMMTYGNGGGASAPFSALAADGWQATVSSPSDLSMTPVAVSRQGYDTTGTATTHADTLYLTKRVRQAYPNQASFTTDKVALSDYLYSTDTVLGATNSSALTSPTPIANWVMPERLRVASSVHWEIVAFHRDARPDASGIGRQVACVRVRANDGTTQTAWQVVSTVAISSSYNDANPLPVYQGDLDVSSLAAGAFWLEGEVYPWFGAAASVLKSEDGTDARGFSRRYFRKGGTTQYVAVKSTGVDASGVVSTTEATAIATPCLTWAGALKKAQDTLGTSNGSLDVVKIVVVDTVSAGTVTFTGSYKQDISAVETTRATGTTRANAIVQIGAALNPDFDTHTIARNEGALLFNDMTVKFTAAVTINGATGVPLSIIFKDCNVDMGGFGTAIRASSLSHLSHFGCTFTNFAASSLNPVSQSSAGEIRILRGNTFTLASQNHEGYLTVGNTITGSLGQAFTDPTKPAIFANNKYLSPGGATPAIIFESTGTTAQTLGHCAVVQNLIEWTSTTASASLRISGDGDEGDIVHAVVHHNVCPGAVTAGRWNLFYDEDASVARNHKLISFKGNIGCQLNTKGDIFQSDGTRLGQFAFTHGVGCAGNYTIDAANAPTSEAQSYPGPGSKIANGTPSFTDNKATTGTPGSFVAGAGGGTYTLQVGSAARDTLASPVLAYDLAGVSRGTGTQDAGAYA